jgi:hypothetical protein
MKLTTETTIKTLSAATVSELDARVRLSGRLRSNSIPDNELLDNLGLFLTRQTLSQISFMQKLYQLIVPVHGVIMEFGVRWGQNMALLSNLRSIYEPYNHNRKVIGFDTFEGFPSVDPVDGDQVKSGDYGVTKHWEKDLEAILDFCNQNAPISHKRKFQLVKGDAIITVPTYLRENPETIVALAYFDFDLYKPTKVCLEAIVPHLTKGSVLAFDELNHHEFPGETMALREVLGLSHYAIRRDPSNPLPSYLVIE